jgi:lipoprotein NlpI
MGRDSPVTRFCEEKDSRHGCLNLGTGRLGQEGMIIMSRPSACWRVALVGVLLVSFLRADETDPNPLIQAAQAYRQGDWDQVLRHLDPLLQESPTSETGTLAREYASAALHRRGEDHFRAGRIQESVADFDREIELHPASDPGHWQRGISYYYAGLYEKGARQFERHQKVNPEDVENAVWHFLCRVRSPGGSVDLAREALIPIRDDERVPMKEIYNLFAGRATIEQVEQAAQGKGPSATFYAQLYIGLYLEAIGKEKESLEYITRAAGEPRTRANYMADVARVHQLLREAPPKTVPR